MENNRLRKHTSRTDRPPAYFYWLFGGVGFLLLSISFYSLYLDRKVVAHYTPLQGEVIKNIYRYGDTTFRPASPVIVYQWQGNKKVFQSHIWSRPAEFDVGEKVMLFVNPDDPSEVVIDSFIGRFFITLITGGLGIVFLGLPLLFAFLLRT